MQILDIINGHANELLNINNKLSENRMKICRKCPIFKDVLGGICNSKLWLNPETNEVSTEPKQGFFRGCNCRMQSKTRVPHAVCVAGKW